MTLPAFDMHTPQTLEEATDLLERYGEDAALYCGGTELLLLMKLGFARYGHLVDVKGIDELKGIRAAGGSLAVGAAATHAEIERSPLVAERLPAFADMERNVANLRVRNAGTIGGNLCFCDPHSDPGTFLLAANATLVARRGGGVPRRIHSADFAVGPYQTALEPGELLVAVEIPELLPSAAIAHRKLAFHERPAATVACLARVEDGCVVEARVAVGSVGTVPCRAPEAERLLVGLEAAAPPEDALEASGFAAAQTSRAVDDSNGSADYKRALVSVLVKRATAEALARAR